MQASGACANITAMRRPLFQFALILLLGFWLCGPVLENETLWDIFPDKDLFPDSGDSVVLILTAAATCVGAVLSLARLILRFFKLSRSASSPVLLSYHSLAAAPVLSGDCAFHGSPPPLRI